MKKFLIALKERPGIALLIASCILLPMDVWGPGLWDPWEMNRAMVARRMAEAPLVLVAESRPQSDPASIYNSLSSALSDDATVISTLESGSAAPLETARSMLSEHVYRVLVLDVDITLPDSEQGMKSLVETLKSIVLQNLSTKIVLVSGNGTADVGGVKDLILARLETEADIEAVASRSDLEEAVREGLGGDAFLAQFKSQGRTQFMAPLSPFIVSLSFRVFGQSEFSARLPGVILSLVCLALVYIVARKLFSEVVATLAMLGLLTAPLFFGSARFVANEQGSVLWLALGCAAFGAIVTESATGIKPLLILLVATLLLWLDMGMSGVVTITGIVVAYQIAEWRLRRPVLVAVVSVVGLSTLLAIVTFLPDAAFFRQFRFTLTTFAGGMRSDFRTFDFVIKEVGFGLFPWSALLPLSIAAAVLTRPKPERLLLLLWAVVPFVAVMLQIRPMFRTFYLGLPALTLLNAIYLEEIEDNGIESRLLAFFGFGLFAVMLKDVFQSPAPLVSFLTTDPMFAEPGKGDIVFPPVTLSFLAKAFVLIAGAHILVSGGRLISLAARLPEVMASSRTFLVVLFSVIGLILLDIIIFLALKWGTISGADSSGAAVGAVLLRIFLTGPDILSLYLLLIIVLIARHAGRVRPILEKLFGDLRRVGSALTRLEQPPALRIGLSIGAAGLMMTMCFDLYPELSYHLSQKHIIESYERSSARITGELFRHGTFTARGFEDTNFYTARIKEMMSRQEVIERLKDVTRRTFFIVPKTQWSEINSAFRNAAGGRFPPVLDDRSSRFILIASSLAPGEEDRNWLAKATLTQEKFDALSGVIRETVNFDDKIHFLGYSIETPAVRRGGKVEIKMYFKAVDRIPVSYRVFMHIDRQGSSSRIHGDHWILNLVRESEEQSSCVGCYATTHWLKGDIIVDTYVIEVPIGSPSGPHDIWMGFYNPSDDRRLPVKDYDKTKVRHDGQNRVRIGVLTVE